MPAELHGVLLLTDYEGWAIEPFPSLKREALFFDRLAVPGLNALITKGHVDGSLAADLTWLMENGILWEPAVDYTSLGRAPIVRPYPPAMMMAFDVEANTCLWLNQRGYDAVILFGSRQAFAERFPDELGPSAEEMLEVMAQAARMMNSGQGSGAMIINDRVFSIEEARRVQQGPPLLTGIEIVVNQFPEPDEMTSWGQIEEFRADHDGRESLRKFRLWLQKCGREGLTGLQVAEEMQDLLADYERYMQVHRMKTNVGLLESLVVGIPWILENLAKLRLGELAKLPFAAKHRRLAQLEAELSAPGREVAYVAKARDWLGQR